MATEGNVSFEKKLIKSSCTMCVWDPKYSLKKQGGLFKYTYTVISKRHIASLSAGLKNVFKGS